MGLSLNFRGRLTLFVRQPLFLYVSRVLEAGVQGHGPNHTKHDGNNAQGAAHFQHRLGIVTSHISTGRGSCHAGGQEIAGAAGNVQKQQGASGIGTQSATGQHTNGHHDLKCRGVHHELGQDKRNNKEYGTNNIAVARAAQEPCKDISNQFAGTSMLECRTGS